MRTAAFCAALTAAVIVSPALLAVQPGVEMTSGGDRAAARWSEEGSRLYLEGRASEAAGAYQRAADADSRNPDAHCRLGAALEAAGETARAEASYRRSLALDASHNDTRLSLASLLAGQGRGAEARAQLIQAALLRPNDASVRFLWGVARLAAGNPQSAADSFRSAVKINPRHADAQAGLGRALQAGGPESGPEAASALETARADLGEEGLRRFDRQVESWSRALASAATTAQLAQEREQVLRVENGEGRPAPRTSIAAPLGGLAIQATRDFGPPPF